MNYHQSGERRSVLVVSATALMLGLSTTLVHENPAPPSAQGPKRVSVFCYLGNMATLLYRNGHISEATHGSLARTMSLLLEMAKGRMGDCGSHLLLVFAAKITLVQVQLSSFPVDT